MVVEEVAGEFWDAFGVVEVDVVVDGGWSWFGGPGCDLEGGVAKNDFGG